MSAGRWLAGLVLLFALGLGVLLAFDLSIIQLLMLVVGAVAAFAWSEAQYHQPLN